jgi:polyhydroxyalkanoic acid synthase PhaR subunit
MSNDSNKPGMPPDPFGMFRQMYSANEEAFSNALNQFVNTDTYAASMGKYMENAMAVQKTIQEQMERYLHANGLPTRNDFTRLSGQIVDIDGRLDDIQAALEEDSSPAEITEIKKLAGQVGALEVRLSRIENILEQIGRNLKLTNKPEQPVSAADDKSQGEGYYALGEASPVNKKAPKRKPASEEPA